MSETQRKPSDSALTQFLVDLGRGEADPDSSLMHFVYEELRRTAGVYLRRPTGCTSLQPTALVHEAFVKVFDREPIEWNDRVHFFALAARAMRQILVDHARRRRSSSSGASVSLRRVPDDSDTVEVDLLDLDEALDELAKLDERESKVVELRYFGGLSIRETSKVLGVSDATVERDWASAKVWLGRRLARRSG